MHSPGSVGMAKSKHLIYSSLNQNQSALKPDESMQGQPQDNLQNIQPQTKKQPTLHQPSQQMP